MSRYKFTIASCGLTLPFEIGDFSAPFRPAIEGDVNSNCVANFGGVEIVFVESFSQVVDVLISKGGGEDDGNG